MTSIIALIKPIELPSGVTASHWEIAGLFWTETAAQILLYGWLDSNARKNDKTPLEKQALITLGENDIKDFALELKGEFPTKQQLYAFLKTTQEWKDSEEVHDKAGVK